MKKIILVCGLIGGTIVSALMVASAAKCYSDLNFENGMIYGYATMILAFSLIFVGVKNFRDKYNNGTITFGKAFKMGLGITLIASTMYVVAWLIEYYFFIPDFMDKYAVHMLKDVQSEGLSQSQIDKQVKSINSMKEMYKNPVMVILFTYAEVLPVGLIITVISSLILRRKAGNKNLVFTN